MIWGAFQLVRVERQETADKESRKQLVLHTCHHRTQVQAWLRLAWHEPVPAIFGPSGDVKWDEADPTYSLEAAKRGG
jgi:hypothetical protein